MKEQIREILWNFVAGEVTDSEAIEQVLDLFAVVGRSEQLVCRDCKKPTKEYRDNLCEPCHKWHTDS